MPAKNIEYKTLPWKIEEGFLDDQSLDSVLKRLGAEGWMLVTVSPIVTDGNTTSLIHHLVRGGEPQHRAGFPIGEDS